MYPTKTLGEICDIQNGYAFKADDYVEKGNIRLIRIGNVQKGFIGDKSPCFMSDKIFQESKIFHLKENDLLISLTGDVGRVGFFPKKLLPALLNQRVGRFFNFSDEIDIQYLFHFFNTKFFEEKVIKTSSGAAQKNTSTNKIKQIQIPLPPLPTQQKIVSKLDNLFSKIDKNIELTKQNIANIDEENNSILEKIFTECEEEFGSEKIEKISENIQYGYTGKTIENGKLRYLRITDIQNNKIIWEKVPFVEISEKEIPKYSLNKGDIVFARTGATVGKSCLIDEKGAGNIFASYLIRIVSNKNLINENFLQYFFYSKAYWEQVFADVVGAAQPNFNGTKLKQIQIPLPPLPNQQKIIEKLDKIFAKNSELKNFYEKNLKSLEELKQSILKQAFEDENFIK